MVKIFSEVYLSTIFGTEPSFVIMISDINLTLFINDSKMDAKVKLVAYIGPLLTVNTLLESHKR